MSVDYMLLGSLDGTEPLGDVNDVLKRAQTIGVDLSRERVALDGVRLELALDVQQGVVSCVHVTPRGGGDYVATLKKLAAALGAVVFDAQTGRALGEPEPELPNVTDGYALQLVSLDMTVLGDVEATWQRLGRSLGASRAMPAVTGEGWSFRAEIVVRQDLAQYIVLHAAWSNAAARDDLFERVVEAADENGWVPFDPTRNDTL